MGSLLAAPFAPLVSLSTYRAAAYLALALGIGFGEFLLLVVGGATGISLSIVWIGVPVLLVLLMLSRSLAAFDRTLANGLLGLQIEAPAASRHVEGSLWRRLVWLVRSPSTWRSLVWLALRLPLAVVCATVVGVVALAGALLLVMPWTTLADASLAGRCASIAGGGAAVLLALHLIDLSGFVHAGVAARLLGPSRREALAMARVEAERATAQADLARELHDSVGHSLTAAVLQASAARKVQASDPAFVASALAAIETQGREALQELDRVLGLLRDESGSKRETPGLDGLDGLFARTRAAGLPLAITQTGDPGGVSPELGREAYRIVQEALTNAMRHALGAATSVSVAYGSEALELRVENGPGAALEPARESGGRGLSGVSERVRRLGGTLEVGPRPDGGYALRAVLPL